MSMPHEPSALTQMPSVPGLPEGVLVSAEDEEGPHLWITSQPIDVEATTGIWADHPDQLQPLLLTGLDGNADRPWLEGELFRDGVSNPDDLDPAEVLQEMHHELIDTYGATNAALEPYGSWPGLAPAMTHDGAQGLTEADRLRQDLAPIGGWHLGLIPASRPADTLANVGWSGPASYVGDTAIISAVLRSWEDRFDARLVAVDFATIFVAVGAPPADEEHALKLAIEHIAFCPDNIFQSGLKTLREYAASLVGSETWVFWWD